jgi:hypothetical protein
MPRGTDAADTAGDMGGFLVWSADQHCLEEARRLGDIKSAFFEFAVLHLDDDVPMPFDPRYLVDVDAFSHVRLPFAPALPVSGKW